MLTNAEAVGIPALITRLVHEVDVAAAPIDADEVGDGVGNGADPAGPYFAAGDDDVGNVIAVESGGVDLEALELAAQDLEEDPEDAERSWFYTVWGD